MTIRSKHYWRREVLQKRPTRFAPARCNPDTTTAQLSTSPQEPLSWFDRAIAWFTTPFKFCGISGWEETHCEAKASGRPVRDAQHSTDGFWTIDVALDTFAIGTTPADLLRPRFLRLEVEPGTKAHAVCAGTRVRGGMLLSFGGAVVVDTDGPFLEVHPEDDFAIASGQTSTRGACARVLALDSQERALAREEDRMITITLTETDYFLPEDGAAAKKQFLALLNKLSEVWISAFGFTLQPMFDALEKADAAGAKIHVLLDHSQSVGQAEAPKVKDLVARLKHGDVTITTAGIHSGAPSQIWHWKGMVVLPTDGNEKHAWEGSTNFTQSAWFQGNSARIFRSDAWARVFVQQFEAHKAWAIANEPQYQVQK